MIKIKEQTLNSQKAKEVIGGAGIMTATYRVYNCLVVDTELLVPVSISDKTSYRKMWSLEAASLLVWIIAVL